MQEGIPSRNGRLTAATPLWLRVSTAASLAVAAASLILALLFSDRADRAETAIESSFTVAGWRNENAIENAISANGEIGRSRGSARVAAASGGFFLAAAIVLMVMGIRDRNRKTEILGRMASEWKEEKAEEIRGFISLHVGTLAQKRIELMSSNDYGVVDESAWHQELVYFINRVLRQHCRVDAESFTFIELKSMVEKQISSIG